MRYFLEPFTVEARKTIPSSGKGKKKEHVTKYCTTICTNQATREFVLLLLYSFPAPLASSFSTRVSQFRGKDP